MERTFSPVVAFVLGVVTFSRSEVCVVTWRLECGTLWGERGCESLLGETGSEEERKEVAATIVVSRIRRTISRRGHQQTVMRTSRTMETMSGSLLSPLYERDVS